METHSPVGSRPGSEPVIDEPASADLLVSEAGGAEADSSPEVATLAQAALTAEPFSEKLRHLISELTPISLFDRAFKAYSRRHHRRARRRAATDPRWSEIEKLRQAHSTDNTIPMTKPEVGLTFEVWEEQAEIYNQINPPTWPFKLSWWLSAHPGVAHPISTFRAFFHRGRHGWAPRDTWSLDCYLAQVISESVAHLRDSRHGYPVSLTDEEWGEILTKIVDAFARYPKMSDLGSDAEDAEARQAAFNEAMDALKKWFPNLWD